MRISTLALLAAVALAGLPNTARAGGFEIPDLGTIPLGRGAAFTARADSLAAFRYNPAGLSKRPGVHVLLSANIVNLNATFTRAGSGEQVLLPWNQANDEFGYGDTLVLDPAVDVNTGQPYPTLANRKRFGPSPMFVASWGDVGGVRGLSLSVGVDPPVGMGAHDWPVDGAQRYSIQSASFLMLPVGVGVAYRVDRYFSIGVTFLNAFLTGQLRAASRADVTGAMMNEDVPNDNTTAIEVRDLFIPSANIGVLSQPLDWLELGASVRLPYVVRAQGSIEYINGEARPPTTLATPDPRVTLKQHFPTVVRAGLRYIHRRFDVEVDFVFENYKSLQQMETPVDNPNRDFAPADDDPISPLDDPSLVYVDVLGDGLVYQPILATPVPTRFRNTYSIRLGGDIEVWPDHLTLRAGGFYASSAYPKNNETYTVRFPINQQFGVGGGLTWHALRQLDVTVGYSHIFQPDVRVGDDPATPEYDGGIIQQNAVRDDDCDGSGTCVAQPRIFGNIINNGLYTASFNIFGLALEAHFG